MNEAELLFVEVLNTDRASLYFDRKRVLDKERLEKISQTLKRRINGEPIQYILGKTEFMGLEFKVTPKVFIPRDDTEILVEAVIDLIKENKSLFCPKILDLCTGSGCIAISLAKFIKPAQVIATDISQEALNIAKENSLINKVEVEFIQSDLFSSIDHRSLSIDIIVSNPPYVSQKEMLVLEPEVKYEPQLALDGGKDGLDFYRRIIEQSPKYLKANGYLVMEMGFGQSQKIQELLKIKKIFEVKRIVKDYNNIERVVIAKPKTFYQVLG